MPEHKTHSATLLIGTSESSPDLYYRTGLFVPDPFVFIEHGGRSLIVLSDLELDRGRELARVDEVLPLTELMNRLGEEGRKEGYGAVIDLVFRDRGIRSATVPGDFPLKYADFLRAKGYEVVCSDRRPFFTERLRKRPDEVEHIRMAQRMTEAAMELAIGMVADSRAEGGGLTLDGTELTSELIKGRVGAFLAENGYAASHTIVASGVQGSMPHHSGSGPIVPRSPVVIDIFPRSQATGYYGDMTRTVVRGEPTPRAAAMYEAVLEAQLGALGMIRAGVAVRDVHGAVQDVFRKRGFETGPLDGRVQGFIHSTGHGLGLEIHEPPRLTDDDEVLAPGMVVTVEPGLYYEKHGGVRIEDVVVVTADGCENLNTLAKEFRV